MTTSTSYGKKLFFYFLSVFLVFTLILIAIQYNRDKSFKAKELESMLETYCEFSNSFLEKVEAGHEAGFSQLDSLVQIFPRKDIRLTLVDFAGWVLYDSEYPRYQEMANHIGRPEIQDALLYKKGRDIRLSESVNRKFYYFAKKYEEYFIRTAVVYGTGIEILLSGRSLFWIVIAFLFFGAASALFFLSNNFGKAIARLKSFADKAATKQEIEEPFRFPENELGFIGEKIVTIYRKLEYANRELSNEKEKLVRHLQLSQEGVAFFSKDCREILANNHFVKFLNIIAEVPVKAASQYKEIGEFFPVVDFIQKQNGNIEKMGQNVHLEIEKNNRFFKVQCFVFQDQSYEISIIDVTFSVEEKMLKHEMTSNIAHELRTPVSSIKGYLETILRDTSMTREKKLYFIEKAAGQTDRLADLIRDMSMLTQMEEAPGLYKQENIDISGIVVDAKESLISQIHEKSAKLEVNVNPQTTILGNKTLVFSIFRNLMENSLNYAGEGITISIDEYLERENFLFFSFSDNGRGIEPSHQQRVFERFYRVDEGRSRNEGGTGLGLAIVKNAVLFHGGEISIKNKAGGGVEFLFSLKKTPEDHN